MTLGEELVALHEAPREVPPFSQRYPGLTPAAGYAAAQRLHEHRVARGITTGVLTDAHPVAPGETWRTDVAGVGSMAVTFA